VTQTQDPRAGDSRPGVGPNLPVYTERQAAELCDLAYQAGQLYERERIAAGRAELDTAWHAAGGRVHQQNTARRIAEMEQHAAKLAAKLFADHGRPPWLYDGGPVDWNTGRPLHQTEAAT
jgi:hypothetical protein